MTGSPVVFFSRCRPQDADPIDIVLKEKRIFIGYPMWRAGKPYQKGRIRDSIVDVTCPHDQWLLEMERQPRKERRFYNQNRNFVSKIAIGSIALVPRPSLGVIFAGRVVDAFELVDDPSWAQDYLDLRVKAGLSIQDHPGRSHVGDVVQGWRVDGFRPVPVPAIPAWIRKSLFGRSTFGQVHAPGVLDLDPYRTLDKLIDQPDRVSYKWTVDRREVERRLLSDVTPSSFEHLCVALLQLEHPDEMWMHVGGSGDGGVDGLGSDATGNVTGLLQCKWAYWNETLSFETHWASPPTNSYRRIVTCLLHPTPLREESGVEFWSRGHIASLVLKHAKHLPMALSMRVGSG